MACDTRMTDGAGRCEDATAAPRAIAWGLIASVGVFAALAAAIRVSTADGGAIASRWSTPAQLLADVRADVAPEASVQELYDRVRAGTLDDATLGAAARAMWSVRVGVDERATRGGALSISLQLTTPAAAGDDLGSRERGPQLAWRLVDVRVGNGPRRAVDGAATQTPLGKIAPTIVRTVALAPDLAAGPTRVQTRVEFTVRAVPGGPVVGTWQQSFSQDIDVARAESSVADAR